MANIFILLVLITVSYFFILSLLSNNGSKEEINDNHEELESKEEIEETSDNHEGLKSKEEVEETIENRKEFKSDEEVGETIVNSSNNQYNSFEMKKTKNGNINNYYSKKIPSQTIIENKLFTKKIPSQTMIENKLFRKIDMYKSKGIFTIQYLDNNDIVDASYNHKEREDNLVLPTVWTEGYKSYWEGSPLPLELMKMMEGDINKKYNFKLLKKTTEYFYQIGAYTDVNRVANLKDESIAEKDKIIDVYNLDSNYKSDKQKEFFLNAVTSFPYIRYLYNYYPLRSGHDYISKRIIELKNNDAVAIEYFYNILIQFFGASDINSYNKMLENMGEKLIPTIICVVPSHEASNSNTSGIAKVARKLAIKYGFIDGVDYLIRKKTIQKKATSGNRNITIDRDTIKVVNFSNYGEKRVIILDDVTTTGNSLLNAKEKIEYINTNGHLVANTNIILIAIGKTVKDGKR